MFFVFNQKMLKSIRPLNKCVKITQLQRFSTQMTHRIEHDSLGEVKISPKDALYGSQTARSLKFFKIGDPKSEGMPVIFLIFKSK